MRERSDTQSRLTLCDPTDCSPPGSSVREHWREVPFPPPGDLLNAEAELSSFTSPALAGTSTTWEDHKLDKGPQVSPSPATCVRCNIW